jgi:imidazole glycerol-phosphate synthase subunit HisH
VSNAINLLGYKKLKITDSEEDIVCADAILLPGVGAFEACAKALNGRNLQSILNEAVLGRKKPILGICVGMQLMATESEENGLHSGLNWIPGRVVRLELPESYAVPHVGWNELTERGASPLFSNTPPSPHFYFDHSFHYLCDYEYVSAQCDYGKPITAAIQKDHIYGVQFHPEKSQNNGLKLFRAFFDMVAEC